MGKKLSPEQKLFNKIAQNINSRRNFLRREGYKEAKDSFLEQYILCEVGLKTILQIYYKEHGEEKTVENIEMATTTIKAALKAAHLNIDDETVDKMFKARQKRGSRSARDLRNGIVHDLNVQDIQEVVNRKDELLTLINTFIKKITAEMP